MPSCELFTDGQIASLRTGGALLRGCLDMLEEHVRPGISTAELDQLAETYIRDQGGVPGFKGYNGFPATLCASVNDQTVHGMPGPYRLREGDIVSLDCGVVFDGLNTDACITVPVGAVSPDAKRLLRVTQQALDAALTVIRAGARVGDISAIIQRTAESGGCRCIRSLTGHGLGTTLHQFPEVPNIGRAGTGPVLPARTIIAVEPILSLTADDVHDAGDGWTLVTDDGSLAAHREHTVLITAEGCEILA